MSRITAQPIRPLGESSIAVSTSAFEALVSEIAWAAIARPGRQDTALEHGRRLMAVFAAVVVLIVGACTPAATTAPTGPAASGPPGSVHKEDR